MKGKIIVAVDGSATGNRALANAAEFSQKLGRDLCIVHVLLHHRPPDEVRRLAEAEHILEPETGKGVFQNWPSSNARFTLPSAEEELERARMIGTIGDFVIDRAKRRAEDLGAQNVTGRICAGDYADEILEVADYEDASMIVVGSRGLGRVREVLLGSVSQKVLHNASRTVVVVP